jgi:uncharacterized protein YkwD
MKNLTKRCLVTFIFSLVFYTAFAGTNNDKTLKTAENVNYLSPFEKEIVYEINLFRSNPAAYAQNYIAPLAKNYKGKFLHYPNDLPLKTKEGVRALNECIRELQKAKPMAIVYPSRALTKAAEDHVKDQSKTGKTGHYGSDRSNVRARIERYGDWHVRIAENIAYGGISARQIVIYLLIDDGEYKRGHRKNFLSPEFQTVGVAVGSHPEYKTMCVMDFAGSITDF